LNDFVMVVLNSATHISSILIIILGSLVVISLPIFLINVVLNLICKQMKVSYYFISFLVHKKNFIKWHKQTID